MSLLGYAMMVLLLLLGCSQGMPSPTALGVAPVVSSGGPLPHQGDPLTCTLEGLSIPFYSGRDPRWGNPTAPVALVVFSDFECPYCARFRLTLDAIKSRYGPSKVQILWKHAPLRNHPHARPAALTGQAVYAIAGAEAFWRYHDMIFANQKTLTSEAPARWAQEAGVSEAQLRQALASPDVQAKVDEDLALGQAIGLQGTPMTILNGFLVEGAQDEETLAALIDEELKGASKAEVGYACARMRAGRQAN
ncbi:MAG: thioredoxin domain-containing protein [Myxococcales bacterium]|nr:thioredoxin domain-containing protein [Myxococcales bacterium]